MYDLIIIGAGPAGVTAGIYAARKQLKTLLVARDFVGQTGISFLVENYPGFPGIRGAELVARFKEHLKKFDIEIKEGEDVRGIAKISGAFEIKTKKNSYQAKAVILATGRDPRPLEVPGEKEFLGRGVAYCVICDGPLYRGKTVAVVGGGNSGFEAALELSDYCQRVYIFERGEKARADEASQEKAAKRKNIEIITNAGIKEIKGKKLVEALVYQGKNEKEKELAVEAVFIQVGYVPATDFVRGLVDFNEWDEIIVDPRTCATKTKGLFAAGDITDVQVKQIVVAAAEGAKAALAAYKYVQNQ